MQKALLAFYNALSWLVWVFFICAVFFLLFLLATGGMRSPVFTVTDAVLTEADPGDPVLAAHGAEGTDWYRLDLALTVSGSKLSPLDYELTGFTVKGNDVLKYGCPGFVEMDGEVPLEFSVTKPAETMLHYYVQYPAGREALLRELETVGFGSCHYKHKLGFIKNELKTNLPGFYLRDYALEIRSATA